MQDKTDDLNTTSKKVGLGIHSVKSKVMKNSKVAETGVSLNGNPLEIVDIFCYLGSIVDSSGGTEEDIKARIRKAKTAFAQLKKVWKSSIITRKTKTWLPKPVRVVCGVTGRNGPNWEDPPQNLRTF